MDTKASKRGLGATKSHQLFLLLKETIVSGRIAPGNKLPGEIALAKEHGLSRVTVRRAMEALANENLVVRLAGKGTLVKEQPVGATIMTASVANLLPNMVTMSKNSNVKLLEFAYVQPPEHIRGRLGLGPSERTQRSVRVRSADDKPFSYLVTHVPEPIALHYNESDLATTPLFVLLERSGVLVDQAKQVISATLATSDVASALQVPVGSPLISLNRVVIDRNQQGVEYLTALYRPDRYRIEIDLSRAGDEDSRYWQTVDGESD
jgi:GntR family transcriptional regulator